MKETDFEKLSKTIKRIDEGVVDSLRGASGKGGGMLGYDTPEDDNILDENHSFAKMKVAKQGKEEILEKLEYVAREHYDILTLREKESLKEYGMFLKNKQRKGVFSINNSTVDHAKEILYYFSRV